MLNFAGVLTGDIGINAQTLQKARQRLVAVINASRNLHPGGCERNQVVSIHRQIAVFAQALHRHADRRLRDPQQQRNIHSACLAFCFFQAEDCFQIVLSGFVNVHSILLSGYNAFPFLLILPCAAKKCNLHFSACAKRKYSAAPSAIASPSFS